MVPGYGECLRCLLALDLDVMRFRWRGSIDNPATLQVGLIRLPGLFRKTSP